MNVVLYITAFLSIGGFLTALEFSGNFYVLFPLIAVVGLVSELQLLVLLKELICSTAQVSQVSRQLCMSMQQK